MQRREFITTSIAWGMLAATGTTTCAEGQDLNANPVATKFSMKFAPHFGMFRHSAGDNLADQLKFAADQGFSAWEDNGLKGRSVDEQQEIARTMNSLQMEMGVFVAHGSFREPTFAVKDDAKWEKVLDDIRSSVDVAERVNAKWMTVVPGGYDPALEWGYQTANCVELLRRCSEIFEPHDLVMVLEPLNWWTNHAGVFLHKIPQAYQICKAVDSPACKILFDVYHQQISEGNLIPNFNLAWDQIAYVQIGDNPGRNEPGTGEIHYANVFRHLKQKGFDGILGMEHGKSRPDKAGEQAVVEAYRQVDPV
jgi:hydroxypyruvate isomerase